MGFLDSLGDASGFFSSLGFFGPRHSSFGFFRHRSMPATLTFTRPLTGEQYHNALTLLKRKLVLEVARDNLKQGMKYKLVPSPTLDALDADTEVEIGMLDEVAQMLNEIERELEQVLAAAGKFEDGINKRLRNA